MKKFLRFALESVFAVAALAFFVASVTQAAPKIPKGGDQIMPVTRYGSAASTTTGSAALPFVVPGLKDGASCVASVASYGTGPAAMPGPVVATADTLTVTMDAPQTAGTTVVNYVCFKS